MSRGLSRRDVGAALGAVIATSALAACSSGDDDAGSGGSADGSGSSSTEPPEPAVWTISPAAEAKSVMPDEPVTVKVTSGSLEGVTVTDADGGEVEGELSGTTWTSTARLRPGTTYEVAVAAKGPDGSDSPQTSTFATHEPEVVATYGIVYDGQTVGVAMPVSIQFDSAVTEESYRKAVEEAVTVTTEPETEGSWGWLDQRQLMWRPKEFWQPGTKVTVDAPLTGYQTGKDKWVAEGMSGSMTIGRQQLIEVDIDGHRLTVTRGGRKIKSYPVSSGKPGPETETRSGMKVVIEKVGEMTMDSATVGIEKGEEGYYNVDTDYNVRVTWTGEFLHSAPWSVGAQGSSNVSHGCVNMAPENARWIFENSIVGDPVDFTGSSREFLPEEGIGVWQHSWGAWQKQSALA